MNDQEILTLFHERSEQAVSALSQKYGKVCQHMAGNFLDSASDAEECVNDAYLVVWNTVPPEQPESLLAYLLGILRNLCHRRLARETAGKRDDRLDVSLDELVQCLPAGPAPQQTLDSLVIRDTLNAFLWSLPRFDRTIFLRRYYFQDSCRQIAKATGRTESAISTRLNRLKQRLKERLIKEGISV